VLTYARNFSVVAEARKSFARRVLRDAGDRDSQGFLT
jgi:hypothetical protein